ncbi:hypothetical protein Chor_014480 [Crotalus horridus]
MYFLIWYFLGGDIWKQQREIGQLILLKGEKEKKTVESQVEEEGPQLVEIFARVNGVSSKNKGGQNSAYNEENLAECIFNFLISGAESTAITLQWALLLMASHPDVQDKVHKEIEKVLGSSNAVGHQDWKKLPYTSAVIYEIQRTKHAFLFRIIKQCAKNVNIFGFLAPKGTFINPDLDSALLDPKLWETPEKFNPSHFLDKDGQFVDKKQYQLLAGESDGSLADKLSRAEFFIFFINLLKAFVFQLPEGEKKTSEKPRIGLTTYPHSYEIRAVPHRKTS